LPYLGSLSSARIDAPDRDFEESIIGVAPVPALQDKAEDICSRRFADLHLEQEATIVDTLAQVAAFFALDGNQFVVTTGEAGVREQGRERDGCRTESANHIGIIGKIRAENQRILQHIFHACIGEAPRRRQ